MTPTPHNVASRTTAPDTDPLSTDPLSTGSLNIVVVAPRFPFPLDRGDRLTVYNLLQFFSQRHKVSLVCFLEADQDPSWVEKLEPFCERVITVPLNKARVYANSLTGALGATPLQVRYYADPAMTTAVNELVAEQKPDLLYAHTIRMGQYIEPFRELPRILAMQISMTLNYRRLAERANNLLRKMLYTVEYRKLRAFEGRYARRFERVLLISPHDLRAIEQDAPKDNVFFSPHGVDYAFFAPDPAVQKEPASLIFTGNMGYAPNVDAALFFYEQIFPLVRAQVPEVRWTITGTNPAPEIAALAADDSVTVTGRVPDLREHLNRAQVALDPLRVGAGLQNKVLEGMSMALPMVITSVANEGIQAPHPDTVSVADEPGRFAQRVVELLKNADERKRMGEAARSFIIQNWSWEKHFDDLEEMVVELVLEHRQNA